jgi:hypothetical protein
MPLFIALWLPLSRLGRQHAALHRVVAALDPRDVQEAGAVAEQYAAWEIQLRQRLQPALGDCARAVGDALAALEMLRDLRMVLEALELVEWRKPRVLVV